MHVLLCGFTKVTLPVINTPPLHMTKTRSFHVNMLFSAYLHFSFRFHISLPCIHHPVTYLLRSYLYISDNLQPFDSSDCLASVCHRMEESLCLSALRSQFYSVPAGGAFSPIHPSALHLHLPGGRYPGELNHTVLAER